MGFMKTQLKILLVILVFLFAGLVSLVAAGPVYGQAHIGGMCIGTGCLGPLA